MTADLVPFRVVAPFAGMAGKERVSVKDSPGDQWVAVYVGDEVVAFGALHRGRRIKGTWTHPEHRGHGYGATVLDELVRLATPGRRLEVLTWHAESWERMGWVQEGTHRHGAAILRWTKPAVRG